MNIVLCDTLERRTNRIDDVTLKLYPDNPDALNCRVEDTVESFFGDKIVNMRCNTLENLHTNISTNIATYIKRNCELWFV